MGNPRPRSESQRREEEVKLLDGAAAHMEELDRLLERCGDDWAYEDLVYRFYHQSFKVYALQSLTEEVVAALQGLALHRPLNAWFQEIVQEGTGRVFEIEHNARWTVVTRPILAAFFHARYMLEMVCKYGKELKEPPTTIPSGWAAVLCLYELR